ncbi:hypothetical protein OG906_42755 (plasmid) [Streptomyces sp. NBC_01426]|uniref:hypothetical protein n=1 Tax=Streptomyces sp. NBC_01426 TaxID=2975866 RepID=UPI002E38016E|nr:hypothetical protein [Streptomyces sp. NBC_01426]
MRRIARLKAAKKTLRARVATRDETIETLTSFKTAAVSQLAAQHAEIERLRNGLEGSANIRTLPDRARVGPKR